MAKKEHEELVGKIRSRLEQEPALSDPLSITVDVNREGSILNRKTVLRVSGRISTEAEGEKVMDTVRSVVGDSDGVEVRNHLVVPLV